MAIAHRRAQAAAQICGTAGNHHTAAPEKKEIKRYYYTHIYRWGAARIAAAAGALGMGAMGIARARGCAPRGLQVGADSAVVPCPAGPRAPPGCRCRPPRAKPPSRRRPSLSLRSSDPIPIDRVAELVEVCLRHGCWSAMDPRRRHPAPALRPRET